MGGSTKTMSTAPKETAGLRSDMTSFLRGQNGPMQNGPAQMANSRTGQNQPQIGAPGSMSGGGGIAQNALGIANQNSPGAFNGPQNPFSKFGSFAGMDKFAQQFDQNMAGVPSGGTNNVSPGADPMSRIFGQNVDQLGGANSPFFANMMGQLQPMFDQQRAEAVAAGREGAGNLTGSGYANSLGAHLNRSLGNEQATAAQYANQALGMQHQTNMGNANNFLQMLMGMGTAGLGQDAVIQKGGMGSMIAPVVGGLAGSFLGPMGTAAGTKVGAKLFG